MMNYDIIIIGAGPAGVNSGCLLSQMGYKCAILEKETFPRFAIGESFLPQNMDFFKESGLDNVFEKHEFKYKNGAEFLYKDTVRMIEFKDKSTQGPFETYQVERSIFDDLCAQYTSSLGVDIFYQATITEIKTSPEVVVNFEKDNENQSITAKFILDASGLAKVLPKQLGIKTEYKAQERRSYFTHIQTKESPNFDTNKILITVDENDRKTWFWIIPIEEHKFSFGVITEQDFPSDVALSQFLEKNSKLKETIGEFEFLRPTKKIQSFTSQTEKIFGDNYLLIGNSGEFLDPIFSSGVTIALKTSSLAAPLIDKYLKTGDVNWEEEYIRPLSFGINTFKYFVEAWYNTDLQEIIFSSKINNEIHSHIISILAGYAWDEKNPYTKRTSSRLKALAEVIK